MKPSNEIIEKFQRVYFEEFGEKISKEEAYEKFSKLVNLLRIILSPTSQNLDQKLKDDKLKNHH
jgi:hypothetical protein